MQRFACLLIAQSLLALAPAAFGAEETETIAFEKHLTFVVRAP